MLAYKLKLFQTRIKFRQISFVVTQLRFTDLQLTIVLANMFSSSLLVTPIAALSLYKTYIYLSVVKYLPC